VLLACARAEKPFEFLIAIFLRRIGEISRTFNVLRAGLGLTVSRYWYYVGRGSEDSSQGLPGHEI
jgi:hypothetical protein